MASTSTSSAPCSATTPARARSWSSSPATRPASSRRASRTPSQSSSVPPSKASPRMNSLRRSPAAQPATHWRSSWRRRSRRAAASACRSPSERRAVARSLSEENEVMILTRGSANRRSMPVLLFFAVLGTLLASGVAGAAPPATTFRGVGTADATTALNAFRAAIGGANNGRTPPPPPGGRREINWDGVALDGTDFNGNSHVIIPNKTVGIPINRFQSRGVVFEEEYAVTGDGFVSANPGVAGQFPAFSDGKTFAMFNDNGIELKFVLPSDPNTAPVQAGVRGFGVIFIDVEKANTTSIEYFNGSISLG